MSPGHLEPTRLELRLRPSPDFRQVTPQDAIFTGIHTVGFFLLGMMSCRNRPGFAQDVAAPAAAVAAESAIDLIPSYLLVIGIASRAGVDHRPEAECVSWR